MMAATISIATPTPTKAQLIRQFSSLLRPVLLCFLTLGPLASSAQETWTLETYPGLNEDATGEPVIVELDVGTLSGRRRRGDPRAGGEFEYADWFLGIPYASPPIGELRFERPQPAKPWKGVRQASRFGSVCPQPSSYPYAGDVYQNEDCLYLNVFSPYKEGSDGPFPVMIFLHGGTNIYGTGNIYYGHLLAQHGVVVVTVNYRLGMLGYLCAMEEGIPGNYGIHDQILMLHWVQENIRQFRGDPDKVTIFGNSAGGGNVGLLTLAPPAKGLFHNVIGQSGSPLAFWCFHNPLHNVSRHARIVLDAYTCAHKDLKEALQCMKEYKVPSAEKEYPRLSPSGADFKPCVDNYLFPDYPSNLLKGGDINAHAYMTGTTKDEWSRNMGWFLDDLYEQQWNLDRSFFDGMDRKTFELGIDHLVTRRFQWPKSLAPLVLNQYTTWSKKDDPYENRDQYVHLMTDLSMIAPTVLMSEGLTKHNVPTYLYTFNHHADYTSPPWWKSYHTMELNYVFGSPFTGLSVDSGYSNEYSDIDRNLSQQMMVWWTNFAKYSNPNAPGSDEWKVFTLDHADHLAIHSSEKYMETQNRYTHIRMWNHVIPGIIAEKNCTIPNPMEMWMSLQHAQTTSWVLLALCITLTVLLVVSIGVSCSRRQRKPKAVPAVRV